MRYIVPSCLIDHFGGCIEPRETSRLYYNTGVGDIPVIAKFRQATKRQYFALMGRRGTQPSTEELQRRQHFADVQHTIANHYADPATLAADKTAFAAQRQYHTFRAYMWHIAESEINATPGTGNV